MVFILKGIRKVNQKVVPLFNSFLTLLCNTYMAWGIGFDVISVPLDCCITSVWHPINRNYVFNSDDHGDSNPY